MVTHWNRNGSVGSPLGTRGPLPIPWSETYYFILESQLLWMPDSDLALGVAQLPVLAPSLRTPLSLTEKTCVALSPFPASMCRTHLHLLNAADPTQISAASFSTFSDLGKWSFCPTAHHDCGIATTSELGLVAIIPYVFPHNLPERDAV